MDKSAIKALDTSIQGPKNGSALSPSISTLILVKEVGRKEQDSEDPVDDVIDSKWKTASYINGLHAFSVVVVCTLLSSPVILLPLHDAIQFPEYWYELLLTFSITYPVHWTLLMMLDNQYLLKIRQLLSPKSCLILALSPMLGFIMIY